MIMLTARQQELLDFLRNEHNRTRVMPSTREIQQHFGFASQTAAMDLLRALERKGAIQRLPGKARAVVLPQDEVPEGVRRIPLLGQIAAGMPQDLPGESHGTVGVDLETLGISRHAATFALRVRGDSMIDAHIMDGDCVILENKTPRSGDIVAALIDGETTLKRYIVQDGLPFLRAENSAYPHLTPAQELVVQGVMVGLLRGQR